MVDGWKFDVAKQEYKVSQSSSMQEDKTNGSKQKLSKREKAQSSMQQEDKFKCEFLIGTMDMVHGFT